MYNIDELDSKLIKLLEEDAWHTPAAPGLSRLALPSFPVPTGCAVKPCPYPRGQAGRRDNQAGEKDSPDSPGAASAGKAAGLPHL